MKKYLILLALVLGLTTNASAALIAIGDAPGGELNMYEIYNILYGTAIGSNAALLQNDLAISTGLYTSSNGTARQAARYAGFDLDLWAYNGGNVFIANFPGGNIAPGFGTNYIVPDNSLFGMFGVTDGGTFYSERSLNSDNLYHFLVLNHPTDPNKLLIGYEDMSEGSDWDYNDFVFEVENFRPIIPEPFSIVLFGLGLLGLAGFRKRQV